MVTDVIVVVRYRLRHDKHNLTSCYDIKLLPHNLLEPSSPHTHYRHFVINNIVIVIVLSLVLLFSVLMKPSLSNHCVNETTVVLIIG